MLVETSSSAPAHAARMDRLTLPAVVIDLGSEHARARVPQQPQPVSVVPAKAGIHPNRDPSELRLDRDCSRRDAEALRRREERSLPLLPSRLCASAMDLLVSEVRSDGSPPTRGRRKVFFPGLRFCESTSSSDGPPPTRGRRKRSLSWSSRAPRLRRYFFFGWPPRARGRRTGGCAVRRRSTLGVTRRASRRLRCRRRSSSCEFHSPPRRRRSSLRSRTSAADRGPCRAVSLRSSRRRRKRRSHR